MPDSLLIDNNKIIYTTWIKFLGLFIDECLSWKIHIENVKNKILPYIGIISKLKYYISLHYLKIIYFSFIYSNLQYLASVWSMAYDNYLNPIKVLQNKAIKFMDNLPYLEPTINLYKPNKLLNIENVYKYKIWGKKNFFAINGRTVVKSINYHYRVR